MNHTRAPFSTRAPWRALVLLVLSIFALDCGEKLPPAPAPAGPFTQLLLSPSNPQIAQGTAQQFTVRGVATSGRVAELTPQVTWRVAREGATLVPAAGAGLLQLEEPGRYQVSAEYAGRTMSTVIIVTAATLKSITLSPSAPQVAKGLTQPFVATGVFSDGTTQDVTKLSKWSIKDVVTGTSVAVISSAGVATAKNVGKAKVTVSYKSVTASTTMDVIAATLMTLSVSPSNPTIAKGSAQSFTVRGTYSDGSVQDLTTAADWAISDVVGSGVASIDGNGQAIGLAVGQATVSASYDGQDAETTLTVTDAALVSLAVSPTVATVVRGTTQPFAAIAIFADGSSQNVTAVAAWTATDVAGSGVASVDGTGLAKANAVGTASITCAYRGLSAAATLTVTRGVLTALAVKPTTASLARGLTQQFTVEGTYADGSKQDLTTVAAWTTTDLSGTDVASVNAAGLTLGKNVGQATVTAAYLGKSAKGTLTVTAATLLALAVAPDSPAINKGATQQFTATGTLSDGTKQDLTNLVSWTATDIAPATGVATVAASGLATGLKAGQSTILASYMFRTASVVLTVRGISWVPQVSGTAATLDAVWGSDANNVWAVGDSGTILKWNGKLWAAQASGSTQYLLGVWGASASNVWAVGTSGTILKGNGTSWSTQVSSGAHHLFGVWGADASNVWAVGDGGTILKWNGTVWTAQPSGTGQTFYSVWGVDANNVWAVGSSGIVVKWNGAAWATESNTFTQTFYAVGGTDASSVWAVGEGGVMVRRSAGSWTAQPSGTAATLYSIGGSDASNLWTVGDSGTTLKWNGTSWAPQLSGTTEILVGAWGSGASTAWAVGADGTILQYKP